MASKISPKSLNKTTTRSAFSSDYSLDSSSTLNNNVFVRNIIRSPNHKSDLLKNEAMLRQSLEELSNDIKEIEDFLTVTEEILRKDKERDNELYERERKRKFHENSSNRHTEVSSSTKIKSPNYIRGYSSKSSSPTLKINKINYNKNNFNKKIRKCNNNSVSTNKNYRSHLFFKNGKVGCTEANSSDNASNIQCTYQLIKHIIKLENEKPLASPEFTNNLNLVNHIDDDKPSGAADNSRLLSSNSSSSSIGIHSMLSIDDVDNNIVDKSEFHIKTISNNNNGYVESNADNMMGNYIGSNVNHGFEQDSTVKQSSVPNNMDNNITNGEQNALPNNENPEMIVNADVQNQVRHLVRRFTARTSKMRSRLDLPPTPSTTSTLSSTSSPLQSHSTDNTRKDLKKSTNTLLSTNIFQADQQSIKNSNCPCPCIGGGQNRRSQVLDPQGTFYISWLCIVSLSFLYNAWVIPFRTSFPFQTEENTYIWLIVDFCADVVYLLDVVIVKHRIMYLYEGFWVRDKHSTRRNYMSKLQFKMDLLALLPLDLLYLVLGTKAVYLRFPRLLKIQSFWEFFKLLDRVIASPHMVRVARTLTYMIYMIHLTACTYYAYSDYQGLGSDRWVFSGKGHPYVRCFAFATKTATSIGKNPKPESDGELLFMTAAWLMGVFVFALLIGQIRDIIATATRSQSEYRQLVDETLKYLRRLNLPADLQRRVNMWFNFTWEQQRTLDEGLIFDYLPSNLKTDIAISVHIQTLSKVQLFADCEEALLRELVLKLRSVIFLPGDYVCRKGEIGKEMYIVKLGKVQVLGGKANNEVLATLSEGSVFGEISLLAINGTEGNRRTADVCSKGFSNLFVLSKSDLNEAIVYYPNAQAILKKRAKSLMKKNADREREEAKKYNKNFVMTDVVISNPSISNNGPKFLKTVMEALPDSSPAAQLLTQGSRRDKKCKNSDDQQQKSMEDNVKINTDNLTIVNEKQNKSIELNGEQLRDNNGPDVIKDEFLTNLTDSEKIIICNNKKETI